MEIDSQTLALIEHVAILLAPRFKNSIPGHTKEDIRQEIRYWALELLSRNVYDATKGPLEHFMMRHCHLRMLNMCRNHTARWDSPCKSCDSGKPCAAAQQAGAAECEAYKTWHAKQQRKIRVRRPSPMDSVDAESFTVDADAELTADIRDLLEFLDKSLSDENKATLAKIRANVPTSKRKKEKLLCSLMDLQPDIEWPAFLG